MEYFFAWCMAKRYSTADASYGFLHCMYDHTLADKPDDDSPLSPVPSHTRKSSPHFHAQEKHDAQTSVLTML